MKVRAGEFAQPGGADPVVVLEILEVVVALRESDGLFVGQRVVGMVGGK